MLLGIYVEIYIPKTNIISFTQKSGKVTQLPATAVQKYVTVMITSVHRGTIMTTIVTILYY